MSFTISTSTTDNIESPNIISQLVPDRDVILNAFCSEGIKSMQAISIAETAKETSSQGFMPSARTQTGSVLDRWLKARSI